MKRTAYGEALQYRPGGTWAGLVAHGRYTTRQAACPRCGAKPGRRCENDQADQADHRRALDREALIRSYGLAVDRPTPAKLPRRKYDHQERSDRAAYLTGLARLGPAALYRLAVDGARADGWTPSTTAGLPLFEQEGQP